jgi:hypothetical protein
MITESSVFHVYFMKNTCRCQRQNYYGNSTLWRIGWDDCTFYVVNFHIYGAIFHYQPHIMFSPFSWFNMQELILSMLRFQMTNRLLLQGLCGCYRGVVFLQNLSLNQMCLTYVMPFLGHLFFAYLMKTENLQRVLPILYNHNYAFLTTQWRTSS